MEIITIKAIKADDGCVLVKDGNFCTSVMLRDGESEEGWEEVTFEEYERMLEETLKKESLDDSNPS